jgi:peptide/nickel transport system substrate-binding protein
MEWSTMLSQFESGQVPDTASSTNISLTFQQEDIWGALFSSKSPLDLSHFTTPTLTKLLGEAQTTSTTAARAKIYSQVGTIVTKNALWLFVVNDKNPRALASTVHGFVEPKSWFVTLRSVWVS